jgi:peptidoglycan hydrolase-like protein with peptidoglycan-binding domain
MKKLFLISEEEKLRILNLHESATKRQYLGEQEFGKYAYQYNQSNKTSSSPKVKEDINPKKLAFGSGGKNNPSQIEDVKKLQQKLMDLGFLKIDTMVPTGYFGEQTKRALDSYNQSESNNPTQVQQTKTNNSQQVQQTKTNNTSGGIKGFFRKTFPNVAQILYTRPLTSEDFTESQKKVVSDVIRNAINSRGQNKSKGCTEYIDYGSEIDKQLNTPGGATTAEMILGTGFSNKFRIATLLGRFCYTLQSDGSYLVKDDYDFHKWKSFTVSKSEIDGMSYPEKIGYIMDKTKLSPYGAIRHIGYLEHPDDAPEATKTKIVLNIDSSYFG